MKHPNRYIKYTEPNESWYAQYLAYKFNHLPDILTLTLEHKLDKEEIDSAIYGQFIQDHAKERKQIIETQWTMLKILEAIIQKIHKETETK